jgi:endoglucanase
MNAKPTGARRLSAVAVLAGVAGLLPPAPARAQDGAWKLNDREYLERPGANVFVFNREYDGMFFDEKTAGIELILHEVRIATGGAVRLNPAPEQWDPIPKLVERRLDKERDAFHVRLRYEDTGFEARVVVQPAGRAVSIAVFLDQPVPASLEGRAGLNLEFLPARYFGQTFLMDGRPALFGRHPSGPSQVRPDRTRPRQFQGYATFEDRGRREYVEPAPLATGRTLVLAPEDPERHVTIQALSGELQLLDGRNVAQNGWFVVRSPLPGRATGKVVEWHVQPHAIPGWRRAPVIGFSQAGYHPAEKKVVVIELDPRDPPLETAALVEVKADGSTVERMKAKVEPWGPYLRYSYARADFSAVEETGLYFVRYGGQQTSTFPIGPGVYDHIWHLTQDVWFPVQMDHVRVNEAYRVWHGVPHLDDARQAPVGIQHFDNYRMGPTTETRFAPGERIPGLAVGGWFDAGDFDIETGHHASTVLHLVDTWEAFRPTRDETLVDQKARFVDIHHPDGRPDILQQIEHGALMLAAQHRAFGRGVRGITDSLLYTYTHLGDASTQTDNLPYDPALEPYQAADGKRSGTPDDRWAFTARMPAVNYATIAALAAASRALRGYDDAFAEECLALAKASYAGERKAPAGGQASAAEARLLSGAELSAVLQLLIATHERSYADRFQELLWPLLDAAPGPSLPAAVRALPHLEGAYQARLRPYVVKYREGVDQLEKQNPYGVPITTRGWAGNNAVITWAATNYHLHRAYPDLLQPEHVSRGLQYILGRHPSSNVSFVSGVGARSKTIAYGSNRADFSFIPGGVVPGVLVLKPDFPEHMEDWPFLWGENEYVIDICANYIFLAHAARDVLMRPSPLPPAPADRTGAGGLREPIPPGTWRRSAGGCPPPCP